MRSVIIVVMLSSFLLASCSSANIPVSEGELTVHFCHIDDCGARVHALLAEAGDAECAFYTVDRSFSSVLKDVRLVIDEDSSFVPDDAVVRTGEGLMHDKFCVIDEEVVLTGSFNPMAAGADDANNVIVIRSVPIAEHYHEVFVQLGGSGKRPSEHTAFVHNGFRIDALACPQDGCRERMLKLVRSANRSIDFAFFTFTDKVLAEELIAAKERGVEVSGIVESWQSSTYAAYPLLVEAGVSVVLDASSHLQHNKVLVVDDAVMTGSYNPTLSADTVNDENILVLHDPGLADAFRLLVEDLTQNFK